MKIDYFVVCCVIEKMTTNLISIVHQIMNCNKWFKHNHPVGVLSTLNEYISHLWHWYVRLIGALQQIWHKKAYNTSNELQNINTVNIRSK